MSNPKDNTSDKLKALLDKTDSEHLPVDDFEKEALEGFSLLEKKSEAFDLKEKLDARIYKDVFSEQPSKKTYWLAAAAGLILLIGFSVYFIKNNSLAERKDLALTTPSKNEVVSPLNLTVPAVPPAESEAKKEERLQIEKPTPEKGNATEYKTVSEPVLADEHVVSKNRQNNAVREREAEEIPAAAPAVQMAPESVIFGSIKNKETTDARTQEETVSKDQVTPSLAANSAPGVQNSMVYNSSSDKSKSAKLAMPKKADIVYLVSYNGGDAVLHNDLEKKLAEKNLIQKFDATLYVNKNNTVEGIKFTKVFGLSTEQQQEIAILLKSLTKFTVDASVKNTAEYKLVFRP